MERILNERYRVGPKIGDGGMAVVYRGFDTLLGRSVAIKVLREQYAADPQFLARFEREAQAVAALTHPNIINIFDVGVDGGSYYFVMEFIDGPNLKEVIRARGSLPVDETIAIMAQVLSGLAYAHARAIVHRDIKPQNILLAPNGVAKVTDFGIAKGLADATLTEAGLSMGTIHYISPEQAHGEPVTPASDLYSAGVMLYEMLTGALPFTGDSAVGVAVKHVHDTPALPIQVNPAIPAPLSDLTMRALEKDPGARFASAKEMMGALRGWRAWSGGLPARRGAGRVVAPVGRSAAIVPAAPRRPAQTQAVPPAGQRRGASLVTWLAGATVLASLLGLLLVGYRLSPFGAAATPNVGRTTATAVIVAASSPPPPPPAPSPSPTATLASTPSPSPPPTTTVAARATAGTPAARASASATRATPAASPTVRVLPTLPLMTATPTATIPPPTSTSTPRPLPTATPTPRPIVTPTIALAVVPNLVGQTLAQSRANADAVGLAVQQVEARYDATIPPGQIVAQDPAPGRQVPVGRTIAVVVSRGPLTVAVPDVRGQAFETARARLEELGLAVERVNRPTPGATRGAVVGQNPAAGAAVPPGTTVTLTVSAGDQITLPDVVGLNYQEAQRALTGAGFTVRSVNGQTREQILAENPAFFTVNPNVSDGQVISQSLPPGNYDRGTAIDIAYYKAR